MNNPGKVTESASPHRNLEQWSIPDILFAINAEDKKVAEAITSIIPSIERLAEAVIDRLLAGGRLFYIGAGTSGRLGVVDASEWVPTFGVEPGLVTGIIAGGHEAMFTAVEFAEDDEGQGWNDLQAYKIGKNDFVIGITASGSAPYVIHALLKCRENGIGTGSISCNPGSESSMMADFPLEVVVGPEFITGSTRMKSGTAQKLVLNMISTTVMIRLGRVQDNRMVHMQLTNNKLIERGVKMVMEALEITDFEKARHLLLKYGSVKAAIDSHGA